MKIIGNLLIYFGLFLIWSSTLGSRPHFDGGQFMLSLLFAVPLLAAGAALLNKEGKIEQEQHDEEARAILSDPSINFFLYLRPFDSTNVYQISDAHMNLFSWELWEMDGHDDIERLTGRALRPTARIVCLGKPGEHRGAARLLVSDDEWQDAVMRLADRAKLIVVIPSDKPGTLWELEQLAKRQLLGKTVFLMPPTEHGSYKTARTDIAHEWARTRDACRPFLRLPEYQVAGALFKVLRDGRSVNFPLPVAQPKAWTKAYQQAIDWQQPAVA